MDETNPQNLPENSAPQPLLSRKQQRALRRQEKLQQREEHQKSASRQRGILWLVVLVVIALIVYGMVQLAKKSSSTSTGVSAEDPTPVTSDDWTKGNPTADMTLIEYSDLQCPACARYYPWVKQIAQEFSNDIRVAYRHYPLKQIHQNSFSAARATEAAGAQGKFWEMHDLLFERQTTWATLGDPRETFESFARQIELDENKYKEDFKSNAIEDAIEADITAGERARVPGTPSFFLNGKKIQDNPESYDEFKQLINVALGK